MTRKRRAMIGSVAALLLALGICFWLGSREIPQQLQRLPNGNTVRLLGVTHPQKPILETGPPLLRLLATIIPPDYHERLGMSTSESGEGHHLAVWIRFGRHFGMDDPMGKANVVVRVWDEHGNCATDRLNSFHFDHHPVYAITPDHFPRRGEQLRFELFSEDQSWNLQHLATFNVTNPLPRDYPKWRASPLPDRQRDQGLLATLERLETGLPEKNGPTALRGRKLLESGKPVWTRATFSMTENGRPTDDWMVHQVTLRDATGNVFSPEHANESNGGGKVSIGFPEHLWNEPAWKFEVTFRRKRNFQAAQTYPFDAVIADGKVQTPGAEIAREAGALRLEAVVGPHSSWKSATSNLRTNVGSVVILKEGLSPNSAFDLVSVKVGRKTVDTFWFPGEHTGDGRMRFSLGRVPTGKAKITFGVRETRKFTFQVRPTIR